MSRIDELLKRLAPDGVPFLPLSRLTTPIDSADWDSISSPREYIDLASVDRVTKRITDTTAISAATAPSRARQVVREGDLLFGTTRPLLRRFCQVPPCLDGHIASTGFCVLRPAPGVSPRWLFHILSTPDFYGHVEANERGASYPAISDSAVKAYRLPVPPVEVQAEVVRILDAFKGLEAELEAELEARRAQYAHYRRAILAPGPGWRTTTVDAVAEVFDGPHATPKRTSVGPWYLSISSLQGGHVNLDASSHLSAEDHATWTRRVSPSPGDTLFSYETRIGQAGYWDNAEPAALGRRMGILRPRAGAIDPRFLTIAYLSPEFQALIKKQTVQGSTVDRISIADLPTWPITLPDLPEQQRIVDLLDSFDALVNDLSSGLPAEIAARRQQYEHYRDRLLTFREAS